MMKNLTVTVLRNGIIASFTATLVLSVMMMMKQMIGLIPEMNPIADLMRIAHSVLGLPEKPLVGWILHFAIGSIAWGVLFTILHPVLPGGNLVKGMVFGIVAWLLMMLTFAPVAGLGLFGMNAGMAIPMMSFMLHLVFGFVLGLVFGKLSAR